MKRILLLTTVFMMMLGTSFSSAQTDADNFYKSDLVSVEKVSFSNQYTIEMEICKIEVIEKVSPDKKDLTFLKKMPTIPVS